MKVSELIELLKKQNPDAEVLIMSRQRWPVESTIASVTMRERMARADDEDDVADEEATRERGTGANDVFIVEGSRLRWGWMTARDVAVH
jgi:hypothetical protein